MNEMNDVIAENPDALAKLEKSRTPKLGVQTLPITFAAL
jgi:hypothetical protein